MQYILSETVDISRDELTPTLWPTALMVTGNNHAHLWRVTMLDNGQPLNIVGVVTAKCESILSNISTITARMEEISKEIILLNAFSYMGSDGKACPFSDRIQISYSTNIESPTVPEKVALKVKQLLDDNTSVLREKISEELLSYRNLLERETEDKESELGKIKADNKDLLANYQSNTDMATLQEKLKSQTVTLDSIGKVEKQIEVLESRQHQVEQDLKTEIHDRDKEQDDYVAQFNTQRHMLDGIMFSAEVDFNDNDIDRLTGNYINLTLNSEFINSEKMIDIRKVLEKPFCFITQILDGDIKLKKSVSSIQECIQDVLCVTKELRFAATMDGDKIGGFSVSPMTAGKQAMFALKLILAQDKAEAWPLLIDQPEDDLDSRSICDVVVEDLKKLKRERQIILVTHNANIVVGADAEEVIVANKHGVDRQNHDFRLFEYMTGSLEYSMNKESMYILETKGIREHACEILDGGESAFQRRKKKYHI